MKKENLFSEIGNKKKKYLPPEMRTITFYGEILDIFSQVSGDAGRETEINPGDDFYD